MKNTCNYAQLSLHTWRRGNTESKTEKRMKKIVVAMVMFHDNNDDDDVEDNDESVDGLGVGDDVCDDMMVMVKAIILW